MTDGMSGRDVQSAATALYGMIVRPATTLCHISRSPATYLAPSVVVFAASVALGALLPFGSLDLQIGEITWDGASYGLIMGAINCLLLVLGIFWIGRRWGGSRSFRRAFPALTYCLVPAMLGISAAHAVLGLYALAVPEAVFPDGPAMAAGLAYGKYIIQTAIGLAIVGWTLLLMAKAIRVLNGFGYVRSAAILALSVLITYAAGLAQGIATTAIYEFVL